MMSVVLPMLVELKQEPQPPELNQLYFPMMKREGLPPFSLGVQVDDSITRYEWQPFLIPDRMYQFPARWMEIEAEPGIYNWTSWLDENVYLIHTIHSNSVTSVAQFTPNPVIIGTKTTPEWARLWPQIQGSPPRREFWEAFARFVIAIIDRYQPWAVEIWNEPDTQASPPDPDQKYWQLPDYYYGAWIPQGGDPYAAGKVYGEFCDYVVKYVRQRRPETRLIVGALMGDMRFLKGAMAGGLSGDYLSVHNYLIVGSDFDETFVKMDLAREISGLPVILSETSIIGDDSDRHRWLQAEYLETLKYDQDWENIPLVLWYSLGNDWLNTALVRNGQITPVRKEWAK